MSERTAYFEVADQDGYVFSNCKYEDLIVYTDTSNQAIHFGNTMSNNSAFMIRNNDVNILRNMSIGKSNPFYPLDVLGNAAIDGSLTSTKHVVSRGLQVKKRSTPYFTDTTLPSGIVTGFSNDTFGLNFSISSNNSTNYIRFITISNETRTELARFTGAGHFGVGTSNPTSKLHVVGNSYLQGNISTGHVFPLSNELYDLGGFNMRFRDLYLSSNTIYLGDGKIKKTAQGIVIMDSNDKTSGSIASMMMLSNNGFIELHTKCNNLGIGTQAPSEKLEVSTGNAKFSSNVYVVQKLSVGSSNPKEALDITGNIIASQNIYTLGNIGIGTSNPSSRLEVNGSVKVNSNLEVSRDLIVQGNLTITGSNFTVNTQIVEVKDNIIVLNSGQVGSGVSAGTAGITIDRGDAVDYQLLFNETTDKFEMGEVGNLIPIASEAYVNSRTYDASNITSGTLPVNRGGTGTTTSTGTGSNVLSISPNITGTMTVNNITASGSISGSGSGISNINATNISSGILAVTRGGTGTTTSTGTGSIVLNSNPTFQGTVVLPDTEVNGMMTSTGNLGIGTPNPLCPLVVQCTSNTGCIKLITNTANAGDQWWMGFCHSANSANDNDRARIGVDIAPGGPGRLYFTTGNAGGQTERMRINEDGSIGIGLINPSTTLEVNGGIKVRSNVEIQGDLTIRGTTTTVDSTTVNIVDNIIRLNNGAAFSSVLQAGLEVNRGAGYSNYLVVFDETSDSLHTGFQGSLKAVPNIDNTLISNGVLLYDNTNKKITSCNNFVYSGTGLGIGTTAPTEQLDVNKNIKVNSNLYILSRLGVATSNPTVTVEINTTDAILIPKGTTAQRPGAPSQGQIRYNTQINTFEGYGAGNAWGSLGGVKDTNQDTYISAESFPTSNDDTLCFFNSNNETLRITANGRIGISNQFPSERLEISGGNAKFSSNIYVGQRISVGAGSNPKESLDITGNILASQNIYSLGNIGIGTSNPSSRLEVNGSVKVNSNLEVSSNITANRTIVNCTNTAFPAIIRADKDMMTAFGTHNAYVGDNGIGGGQAHLILSGITDYNKRLAFMYNTTDNFAAIQSMIYQVGGTPLVLNLAGGNVGIGTSNPSSRFEVNGSAKISSNLEVIKDLIVNGNLIVSGSNISSGSGGSSSSSLISTTSNIVPTVNGTLDLGAPDKRWRNLYLSGNLISFGNGLNIDGYSWSYLANYVVPPREVTNTVSTYLFTGAAQDHSAYVRNGELFVFGRNDYGQLGLNHTSNIQVPTKVPGIANAALVACGERFTLCVKTDGTVVSAGLNVNGQLGNNSTITASNFVNVIGLSNVISAAAGYTHSLFMTSNGIVVGCGSDANGQLGRGASSSNIVANSNIVTMLMPIPQNGEAPSTFRARAISAGGYHTCVLLENGSVYLCGKNDQGQCGASPILVPQANTLGIVPSLSNVVDVACGHEHTLFVRYDGQVLGFGRNDKGQLGQGTKNSPVTSIVQILAGGAGSSNGLSVKVAAGLNHSAIIKADNTIWVVGANDKGQLGLGQSITEALTLTQIVGYAGYDVACGRNHTVISTTPDPLTFNYTGNNALIAFGDNTFGQMGDNNPNITTRWFPNRIHDGTFQKKLWVGCMSQIGSYIDTDGALYITGNNGSGQLGDDSTLHKRSFRPVSRLMSQGRRIVAVACGSFHTLALDSSGCVHAWGANSSGQLGNNSTTNSSIPIDISGIYNISSSIYGKTIVAIACGASYTLVLDSTGRVHAWGYNYYGQLGRNNTTDSNVPIDISSISNISSSIYGKTIVAIACGANHTIALDSTGRVHTWGRNGNGQLGNSSTAQSSVPIDISSFGSLSGKTIVAIACGFEHTLALDSTGRVHAWGINAVGQLGINNTTSPQSTPIEVGIDVMNNISTADNSSNFFVIVNVTAAQLNSLRNSAYFTVDNSPNLVYVSDGPGGDSSKTVINFTGASYNVSWASGHVIRAYFSILTKKTIVSIACGSYHNIALDSTGRVHTWGHNLFGAIGNNTSGSGTDSLRPIDISSGITGSSITGKTIVALSGGVYHTMVLDSDGRVHVWGENSNGRLGINSTTHTSIPVFVDKTARDYHARVLSIGQGNHKLLANISASTSIIKAVGSNTNRQIGDNTTTSRYTPVDLSAFSSAVISTSDGTSHSAVALANGEVWCWGANGSYQCGVNNGGADVGVPTKVVGVTNAIEVACGINFTLVRNADDTVLAFGGNTSGQLGVGSDVVATTTHVPTLISALSGSSGSKMIAAGSTHAASVDGTGTLRIWGAGAYGKLGLGSTSNVFTPTIVDVSVFGFEKVTHVALGQDHSIIICSGAAGGGKVYTAGLNDAGQLGRADGFGTSTGVTTFGLIQNMPTPATPLKAACGNKHTVIHVASDRIVTFGERGNGQTIVSQEAAWVPQLVEVIGEGEAAYDVRAVVASGTTTHVEMPPVGESESGYNGVPPRILTMGIYKRWGRRAHIGKTYGTHSIVVTSAGVVYTAGYNNYGQLGNETTSTSATPQTVISSKGSLNGNIITEVAGGLDFTVAVDILGRVHTWGNNWNGQMAERNVSSSNIPVNVSTALQIGSSLINKSIVAIACGGSHTLALDTDGSVHAWGKNQDGQLGRPGVTETTQPQTMLYYIIAISCGFKHSVALSTLGKVFAWGYNTNGQCGCGNNNSPLTSPVDISNISGSSLIGKTIVAIACGGYHTLALDSTGCVHAWGATNEGQVAGGREAIPTNISINNSSSSIYNKKIVAIAAGLLHSMAIDSTGRLHAWGYNTAGQIGNNGNSTISVPIDISGISGSSLWNKTIVAVSCGGSDNFNSGATYALDSTGRIHVWGYNLFYQLGNSISNTLIPNFSFGSDTEPVQNLFVNFTGQHRCFVDALAPSRLREHEGLVVVSDKNKYVSGLMRGHSRAMGINQALPLVSLSRTPKDPRAFGVISMVQDHPAGPTASLTETQLQKIQEQGDVRVQINSIGEGCIWVCDENGILNAGDYVTTSSIPGYAMRQLSSDNTPDNVLRNYTVAKLTMDCDFTQPMVEVEEVQKDEYGNVILDELGAPVYMKVMTILHNSTTSDPQTQQTQQSQQTQTTESVLVPATEPAYQMRWLSFEAESSIITQITKEQYEERKNAGDTNLIRAAFLGCTYHCG